jgi:5'-methylthioadenosine phosphorylase
MIGVIGGTGAEALLDNYDIIEQKSITTKYGDNPTVTILDIEDRQVCYIPRHSKNHSIPPHMINYRANIDALSKVGVTRIFATNSVGSLDEKIGPGSILIADNFIDFTKNRKSTFYDDKVVHIDCTNPYCEDLRSLLNSHGNVHPNGTYIATEGPRFETKAEIQFYKMIGGAVVGMTGVPEVVLARERQMCYSSICAVTNYAAGISSHELTISEVIDAMKNCEENLLELLIYSIKKIGDNTNCTCQKVLNDAII